MTADREWLLADAMRLENKQPDDQKPLWLVSHGAAGPQEMVLVVEALTAPGARAVMETLDLAPRPPADLAFGGPFAREAWPASLWYRWLSAADLDDFFASLGIGGDQE